MKRPSFRASARSAAVLLACCLLPRFATAGSRPPCPDAACTDYAAGNHLVAWYDLPVTPSGGERAVAVHDGYVYTFDDRTLGTWLPGTDGALHAADALALAWMPVRLMFAGDLLFVSTSAAVIVIDVGTPGRLRYLGATDYVAAGGMAYREGLLYLASGSDGIGIYDVHDPTRPVRIRFVDVGGSATRVVVGDRYGAVVVDGDVLRLMDLIDPQAPILFLYRTYRQRIESLALVDGYLLVAAAGAGTYVFNLGDLQHPFEFGKRADVWGGLVCVDKTLLVPMDDGLHVLDLTGLPDIVPLQVMPEVPWSHYAGASAGQVYARVESGCVGVLDYTRIADPMPPPVVMPGAATYLELWSAGDLAIGFEVVGLRAGLRILDVGCEGAPVVLNEDPGPTYVATGCDVDEGLVAFSKVVPPLEFVDIRDPRVPAVIGSASVRDGETGTSVALDGRFAYLGTRNQPGRPRGVWAFDIADPTHPVAVAHVDLPGDVIGIARNGRTLFAVVAGTGAYAFDIATGRVRDDGGMRLAPRLTQVGFVALEGDWEFTRMTNQGAILQIVDGPRLLTVDGRDPADLRLVSTFVLPSSVSHASCVADGPILYVPTVSLGVLVLDTGDPAAPRYVGCMAPRNRPGSLALVGGRLLAGLDSSGLVVHTRQCAAGPELWAIDIRPGSANNPVNCRAGQGIVPVAILGSPDHDVRRIDAATVRFGLAAAEPVAVGGGRDRRRESDLNGDGDPDLLFHFRFGDTGIRCGDTEATLTARTFDGRDIAGTDHIRTVGRGEDGIEDDPGGVSVTVTPNPFNPRTTISFTSEVAQPVSVAVYDVRGRLVAELMNATMPAGMHEVAWSGQDGSGRAVPSGTYFLRYRLGDATGTRKMLLVR